MVKLEETGALLEKENRNQAEHQNCHHRTASEEFLDDAIGILTQKERPALTESGLGSVWLTGNCGHLRADVATRFVFCNTRICVRR